MNKLCIYYVEDNAGDRSLLAFALSEQQQTPFELHVAKDGEEALDMISEVALGLRCPPDLIVLDLNLPKRSGIEVLAAIRKHPQLQTAPVMILTSSDAPADRSETEGLGIAGYLRKPMDLEGFMALGGELLRVGTRGRG